MVSVPLPVRLGWYAFHFGSTAAEAQIRMTHAMWMALIRAHPLAPGDLKETCKVRSEKAMPRTTADETKRARPKAAVARRKATVTAPRGKSKPAARPDPAATAQAGPADRAAQAPASRKRRRAPSAPPSMPDARSDG